MVRDLLKRRVFVDFAGRLAELSTCKRRSVGCIIITPTFDEVIAIGYNGRAIGEDHGECTGEMGDCGCIHAEANAIAKMSTRERGLVLISTCCPCSQCAGLIVNSRRIEYVWYVEDYRTSFGYTRLKNANIDVVKV